MTIPTLILVLTSICTAVFASVTAPIILSHRTERMHREDMLEQYKREDRVAAAAKKAADDLVESQRVIASQAAEAAALLAANNELVHRTSAGIATQLGTIHTLVNSNLTMSKQSELSALQGQLALIKEVLELKYAAGSTPGPETIAAQHAITRKIEDLSLDLSDRAEAAAGVAAAVKAEEEEEARRAEQGEQGK